MPSSTILRITGALAMTSALGLAACGGDNSDSGSGAAPTTGAPTTAAATAAATTAPPTTGAATTTGGGATGAKTCANATPGGGLERLCKADSLVVGVKFDQPLFGLKNPTTGKVEGFDVEIATLIAKALGKDASKIDFQETVSRVREDVIQNGQRDYVVATYTINNDRKQKVGFAGPYYVAGQDIMVKASDSSITGKESLDGKQVCTAVGSTPEKRLREETKAQVVTFDTYSECAEALRDGRVQAVSTDNVILLGLIQQSGGEFKLVGKPFSSEPYGIGVKKEDAELRGFINDVLETSYKDGSWQKAFDATVGTVDDSAAAPPAVDRYP
jgi:glutamate transport system substrate-binding protein